jgi:hypothetical protein
MVDIEQLGFLSMARDYPVRTALFSAGPPFAGLLILANFYVHGRSLVFPAIFALLLLTYSVMVTQYYLTVYTRETLQKSIWDASTA